MSSTASFEPTAAAAAAAAALQRHQPKTAACRPVAEFLFHLTRMLSDPANHHLIEWDAGRIVVHDPPAMETEVLGSRARRIGTRVTAGPPFMWPRRDPAVGSSGANRSSMR